MPQFAAIRVWVGGTRTQHPKQKEHTHTREKHSSTAACTTPHAFHSPHGIRLKLAPRHTIYVRCPPQDEEELTPYTHTTHTTHTNASFRFRNPLSLSCVCVCVCVVFTLLTRKVRYEDQQKINEFGRLNNRLLEIRDDKSHMKVSLYVGTCK